MQSIIYITMTKLSVAIICNIWTLQNISEIQNNSRYCSSIIAVLYCVCLYYLSLHQKAKLGYTINLGQ